MNQATVTPIAAVVLTRTPFGWSCTLRNPHTMAVVAYGFCNAAIGSDLKAKQSAVAKACAQLVA